MKLIVGLGNPGSKYSFNRHNIGFMALDTIASEYADSKWKQQFQSLIIKGDVSGHKCLMMKPQTFMNNSGQAVGEVVRYFQIKLSDVIVFHDEIDLKPSKIRLKTGGGHAGHNGLRSICAHIGVDFQRVRLGVGHPGSKDKVHNYVLGNFSKSETDEWLRDLLDGIRDGFPKLLENDSSGFLNSVNNTLNQAPEKTKSQTLPPRQERKEQKENKGVFAKLGDFFKK